MTTVGELLEYLAKFTPDTPVYLASDPEWNDVAPLDGWDDGYYVDDENGGTSAQDFPDILKNEFQGDQADFGHWLTTLTQVIVLVPSDEQLD